MTTPSGVRDRALLLLLATTGMRNKELRSLELQDIHWRAAEVFVRRTKARRDRVVPLLQEAGEALAEYVLHARSKSDSQRVFLSDMPPVRPSYQQRPFRGSCDRHWSEAGSSFPVSPAPIWCATAWQRSSSGNSVPINEVADLLGHRSIDTTAIYVKVALPQLADVALPFPGGAS